jgi:hypothetical protein
LFHVFVAVQSSNACRPWNVRAQCRRYGCKLHTKKVHSRRLNVMNQPMPQWAIIWNVIVEKMVKTRLSKNYENNHSENNLADHCEAC